MTALLAAVCLLAGTVPGRVAVHRWLAYVDPWPVPRIWVSTRLRTWRAVWGVWVGTTGRHRMEGWR